MSTCKDIFQHEKLWRVEGEDVECWFVLGFRIGRQDVYCTRQQTTMAYRGNLKKNMVVL